MKISVCYLSNRWGGIDILWANMKRQDFEDWELVLVDALWQEREKEVKEYINDPRLKYVRQNAKPEEALTGLAHADNQGFSNCEGELIVWLQDYIWMPYDALSKYWFHHQNHPEGILVTGVGDQYNKPSKDDMVDEHGKITVFKEPYKGKPTDIFWKDPRKRTDQGTFYMCNPQDWEMNYCSIPNKVIQELGGMDENYDTYGFAWDNVNIAVRAEMLGYHAYIDQTNECMGFNHDGWWPNPLKVERKSPMVYHLDQMNKMMRGEIPIRYNYLKK